MIPQSAPTVYPGPTPEDLARIPADVKARPQWVLWQGADRKDTAGNVTGLEKIPYQCDDPDRKASSTDQRTWSTYQDAVAALPTALEGWELADPNAYRGGGIGYVFTADDPFTGIDLDHSVDPVSGAIEPWAQAIIDDLQSYTQRSCSGTGLHVIVRATLPPGRRQDGDLQMWDTDRFFAMTGWHLPGTPATIEDRQGPLEALWCAHFGAQVGDLVHCVNESDVIQNPQPWAIVRIDYAPDGQPFAGFTETTAGWPLAHCEVAPPAQATGQPQSPPMGDDLILQKAATAANGAKFTQLWHGDWTGYSSQSEADLALCEILAFWTQDPDQLARLFEQSGLYRAAKWGKRFDYRQRTIAKALAGCSACYQPPATLHVNGSHSGEGQGISPAPPVQQQRQGAAGDKTQAQHLVDLAMTQCTALFHTPDGEAYASLPVAGHTETWPLRVKGFRRWLARLFYDAMDKVPGAQALHDALTVLEGEAQYKGAEHPVFTRLAAQGDVIYLDLGNPQWQAVEVTAQGWRVLDQVPVQFRRARGMLPLPVPTTGGSLALLRDFLNLGSDEDWYLLVAWLLAALRPSGPYPVLVLYGEQGSAKSTQVRVLRSLLDPNAAALRTTPRDERDLVIAATNSWCIALDNLSHLQDWLSDALCRLATGSGFATRELYSNDEEAIFQVQRPIVLNGIEELATRADLLDRAIVLYLPRIPENKRQEEATFWARFEQERPAILGALLDIVSQGMQALPTVQLARLPRMADFAKWSCATAPACGWTAEDFLQAYSRVREASHVLTLEASPVGMLLWAFIKQEPQETWEGTASALLAALEQFAAGGPIGPGKVRPPDPVTKQKTWPKNGRAMSNALRRLAPTLRTVGVDVVFDRESGGSRQRTIRLAVRPAQALQESQQPGTVEAWPEEASERVYEEF